MTKKILVSGGNVQKFAIRLFSRLFYGIYMTRLHKKKTLRSFINLLYLSTIFTKIKYKKFERETIILYECVITRKVHFTSYLLVGRSNQHSMFLRYQTIFLKLSQSAFGCCTFSDTIVSTNTTISSLSEHLNSNTNSSTVG